MTALTRDDFLALDAADELAPFREQFVLPDDVIYMDGNSLGVLPRTAAARVQDVVTREWGQDLIKSWNSADWINLPQRVGALIAGLIGTDAANVVAADSTSINLYKLAAAALRMQAPRRKIITELGNFPTDLYVLQGLAEYLDVELVAVPRDQILDVVDEDTALVSLTHVHYKTGVMFDMPSVTKAVQAKGALMLWDLCHSAGALPVRLEDCNADMAIGCGYKYLNGGPGAPAFLYVAARHQAAVQPPLSGWMGHARPFDFTDVYTPAAGITRNLCGTPGVIAMSILEESLKIFAKVDLSLLRKKSQHMGQQFMQLIEQECATYGFTIVSPWDNDMRGSQVSLGHDEGYAIMQALIARGLIGDFRAPEVLRFGLTPLYLRYQDLWDAVAILRDVMESGVWNQEDYKRRSAVT
ncbi:kynureninase [Govanella unica]|uniref:Kynureninase n=1 Tax=Govanella unica TaxID=2975056 RepID=A0A9X3Z7B9_9PROT|nr:kynureninase [Govania unica]MDA5194011.1 kynureninase [Govania unica]